MVPSALQHRKTYFTEDFLPIREVQGSEVMTIPSGLWNRLPSLSHSAVAWIKEPNIIRGRGKKQRVS